MMANTSQPGPAVSIVIPTRNRAAELAVTLDGLKKYPPEYLEVIVVSNDCTDNTNDLVEGRSGVVLVRLEENLGMPAINHGFEVASAPVVMALDDDALPAEGVLERAVQRFATEPDLHLLACAIREHGRVTNAHWCERTLCFVGCGAFFRKATLDAVGRYSWHTPWLGNEKECMCRFISAGHHAVFDRECVVEHRRSLVNRSWDNSAFQHARDTTYRVGRYYSLWCIPPALGFVTTYHLKRVLSDGKLTVAALRTLARGMNEGLHKGWRSRSPIGRRERRAAGRIWRAEFRQRGPMFRLLTLLLPRDFWW